MATGRGPRPRRVGSVVGLVLAVAAAVAAARLGLAGAGPAWARLGLVLDAVAAVAAGLIAYTVLRRPRDRRSALAWVRLTAFPLVWSVAPLAWVVDAPDVVPDVARAAAVLLVGGSWWYASRIGGMLSRVRSSIDGGIGAAAAFVLGWDGPLSAAWAAAGGGAHGAVAVGVPVAMVGTAVLGATITLTEMVHGRRVRPTLFVLAMLTLVASDVAAGTGRAPFWAAGWVLYALAMRLQVGLTPRVVRVPTRGRLLYLPYAMFAPAVVVVAVRAHTGALPTPLLAAGVTMVALLVARQHVTLLENGRLVERLEETERLLRHRATHDSLTDLPGRAALHEHLSALASPRGTQDRPLAVAFADIDDFKGTNDRFGHAAGDAVLVEVARRLVRALPHDDPQAFAARLGGDEFAVVVTGAGAQDAGALAALLTTVLNGPVRVGARTLDVHVSVGAAGVGHGDLVPSSLLHEADLAMYEVKRTRAGQTPPDAAG